MKNVVLVLALFASLTTSVHAADGSTTRMNPSEYSLMGGVSVVAGSFMIVTSPFVLVSSIVDSIDRTHVEVHVHNNKGEKEKMLLSREVVVKADLQPGDTLAITPAKSGAVLSKNDKPVVFMVNPENTNLTRSHELAK